MLVGGGGAPGPQINTNAEIYYPPYLFSAPGTLATRPAITAAPTVTDIGRTAHLTVTSARPIARMTLVKTAPSRTASTPSSAFSNSRSRPRATR